MGGLLADDRDCRRHPTPAIGHFVGEWLTK
jgi:hypothetical protein